MVYADLAPNVLPVAPRDVVRAADEPDPGDDAGYPQHLQLIDGLAQEDCRNQADADIAQCRERCAKLKSAWLSTAIQLKNCKLMMQMTTIKRGSWNMASTGSHESDSFGQLQHSRFPEYLQRSIDQHRRGVRPRTSLKGILRGRFITLPYTL